MKVNNYANFILIALGVLLAAYTFYKAFNSSFTHDESFTYNNYVNIPVSDIINYTNCPDIPNNHIFNTLLMKGAQALFGNSEFVLRLPNLLAHLLYMVFSFLWLRKFNDTTLLISGFIVLNVNVYLLDFFSIARGYGLSVSFMLISIYYSYELIKTLKSKYSWLSFFFAGLAVWSNFTVLNYYVALLLVYMIALVLKILPEGKKGKPKVELFIYQVLPLIVITCILYWLISTPLAIIKGNLFGPEAGFYHNTIRSLVYSTVRFKNGLLIDFPSYFVVLIFILSVVYYVYDLLKKRWNALQSANHLFLLILFFAAFSTVLQHYLFNTQFLENRTGLFYIVLFNICFLNLYFDLLKNSVNALRTRIIFSLYPFLLVLVFVINFNPNYYYDWIYEANTKEMLMDLKNDFEASSNANDKVNLGITWLFEPSITFYRTTNDLEWLNPVSRDGYDHGNYNYYYLLLDPEFIKNKKLTVIREYDIPETVLAKN